MEKIKIPWGSLDVAKRTLETVLADINSAQKDGHFHLRSDEVVRLLTYTKHISTSLKEIRAAGESFKVVSDFVSKVIHIN